VRKEKGKTLTEKRRTKGKSRQSVERGTAGKKLKRKGAERAQHESVGKAPSIKEQVDENDHSR